MISWIHDGLTQSVFLRRMQPVLQDLTGRSLLVQMVRQRPWLLAVLCGLGLGTLILIAPAALKVGWITFLALTLSTLTILQRMDSGQSRWLIWFFVVSLSARVVALLALYLLSDIRPIAVGEGWVQTGGFFIGDGAVYAHNGYALADNWRLGLHMSDQALRDISMSRTTTGYDYLVGLIVYWLGYHPVTFFLMNALVGAGSAVLAYWIAQKYLQERFARLTGILVSAWPSLFLWSTQNLKEPLTVLILLGSLYCLLIPTGRRRWLSWPIAFVGMLLLTKLNRLIGPLFIVAVPVTLFLYTRRLRVLSVTLLLFLLTLGFIGDKTGEYHRFGKIVDEKILGRPGLQLFSPMKLSKNVEYLRRVRMDSARTPFFQTQVIDTPLRLLAFLPLGLMAILTAPFPWAARSSVEMLGSLEMLLWYPLLFYAFQGGWINMRGSIGQRLIVTSTVIFCIALALLEGNVGTLFRHRAAIWPLLLFFVATALQARQKRIPT